jgi:DNA-binding CsgD family transcriptional regulator
MGRLERASALISDIYGATLDAREWPRVMQHALELIGGSAAVLFTRDRHTGANSFECRTGSEESVWSAALAGGAEHLSLRCWEDREPVGTVFVAQAAHRPLEYIGTLLERSAAIVVALYVCRQEGKPLDGTRSRTMLGLLAPHFSQALRIGRLLAERQVPDLTLRMHQAARRYGLTPAEARVVQALISGCTIERGAQLLGIRPATVKTHLQHVFDKTAARRQVDLIKLIAESAPEPSGAVMLGGAVAPRQTEQWQQP